MYGQSILVLPEIKKNVFFVFNCTFVFLGKMNICKKETTLDFTHLIKDLEC